MARLLRYLKQKPDEHRFDRPEDRPMCEHLREFWRDERGCVPMMEWMLVASILTLGAIATQLVTHRP